MDTDNEARNFGMMLAAIAVFLITGFSSCSELQYVIWGRMSEA